MTSALLDDIEEGQLKSLKDEDVEPYLMENLKYRITLLDNTEVSNKSVPSLKIEVVSSVVTMGMGDHELPTWGEMVRHFEMGAGGVSVSGSGSEGM